jgi:hypothetical protein
MMISEPESTFHFDGDQFTLLLYLDKELVDETHISCVASSWNDSVNAVSCLTAIFIHNEMK